MTTEIEKYAGKVKTLREWVFAKKITLAQYWRAKAQLKSQLEGGVVTLDSLAQVFEQNPLPDDPSSDSDSAQS